MKVYIKDEGEKIPVDVCDKDCPRRTCFWPRPDPGVFTQGRGYKQRPGGNHGWICGTREIKGCPVDMDERIEDEKDN